MRRGFMPSKHARCLRESSQPFPLVFRRSATRSHGTLQNTNRCRRLRTSAPSTTERRRRPSLPPDHRTRHALSHPRDTPCRPRRVSHHPSLRARQKQRLATNSTTKVRGASPHAAHTPRASHASHPSHLAPHQSQPPTTPGAGLGRGHPPLTTTSSLSTSRTPSSWPRTPRPHAHTPPVVARAQKPQ